MDREWRGWRRLIGWAVETWAQRHLHVRFAICLVNDVSRWCSYGRRVLPWELWNCGVWRVEVTAGATFHPPTPTHKQSFPAITFPQHHGTVMHFHGAWVFPFFLVILISKLHITDVWPVLLIGPIRNIFLLIILITSGVFRPGVCCCCEGTHRSNYNLRSWNDARMELFPTLQGGSPLISYYCNNISWERYLPLFCWHTVTLKQPEQFSVSRPRPYHLC